MVPHLSVQSVSSSRSPLGGHVLPGDDEGADGLHSFVSGESLPDVSGGPAQYRRAAVLPVVDLPLSVTAVQVSQQGCNHFETGGHLPEVLLLSRRLDESHKSIRVDLEREADMVCLLMMGLLQDNYRTTTGHLQYY